MHWLAVMTLADGSRAESSLPTIEETDDNLAERTYRVRRPDGSVTVFATLAGILEDVREHGGPKESATVVGHDRWRTPSTSPYDAQGSSDQHAPRRAV